MHGRVVHSCFKRSMKALTCHGEGLGESVDGEGARPHAGEGSEGVVLGWRVDDVLVDLVRQNHQPRVLRHHLCQLLQCHVRYSNFN